jgi:hypothetical protein
MHPTLLRMFHHQIVNQCAFADMAAHYLKTALRTDDTWNTFYSLQNLLASAANLSNAFWGQGGALANERAPLRKSLDVLDSSPLRPTIFRNHFEHFDECLDRWWKLSTRHNQVDFAIAPQSALQNVDHVDCIRMFDPDAYIATFWGDTFDVKAIMAEIYRIWPLAHVATQHIAADSQPPKPSE